MTTQQHDLANLADDETTSRSIIAAAFREAGISTMPFFGEAYEPGVVIQSIVRQVAALRSPQDEVGGEGEGEAASPEPPQEHRT